jgi:hypothetical protein
MQTIIKKSLLFISTLSFLYRSLLQQHIFFDSFLFLLLYLKDLIQQLFKFSMGLNHSIFMTKYTKSIQYKFLRG